MFFSIFNALKLFMEHWDYSVFEDLVEFPCETFWAQCMLWGISLANFISSMEINFFKFSILNWVNLVICILLGNYPYYLGFQMYFHISLQSVASLDTYNFLNFSCHLFLTLDFCAFIVLPLSVNLASGFYFQLIFK